VVRLQFLLRTFLPGKFLARYVHKHVPVHVTHVPWRQFHVCGRTVSTGLRRRLQADGRQHLGDLGANRRTVLKFSETLVTLYKATRGHITPLQLASNINIMSN
jgi:hypothetical protein